MSARGSVHIGRGLRQLVPREQVQERLELVNRARQITHAIIGLVKLGVDVADSLVRLVKLRIHRGHPRIHLNELRVGAANSLVHRVEPIGKGTAAGHRSREAQQSEHPFHRSRPHSMWGFLPLVAIHRQLPLVS
jgi:hypothetical protein